MGCNRREFLKIAGLSTLLGAGGNAAFELLRPGALEASEFVEGERSLESGRWSMVIDMRKCLGERNCTKCMDACHETHNVPDFGNPKDEVKWIWKEPFENTFPDQENEFQTEALEGKPFVVLCNHCEHPPCVRVCPTQATFKRKKDGIVMMDYHRCIGCRFCMAACPYGSRSFNWRIPRTAKNLQRHRNPKYPTRTKGVVEKCTFCDERLAVGLGPKCVEACDEKALIFGDLDDPKSVVREILRSNYSIRRKPELGTNPSVFYLI